MTIKITQLTGEYDLSYYDNAIPVDLQQQIYEYAQTSTYYVAKKIPQKDGHETFLAYHWTPINNSYTLYYTNSEIHKTEFLGRNMSVTGDRTVARIPTAWDEQSLQDRCPLLYKLWTCINDTLDNKFELSGLPEGCMWPGTLDISPLRCLPRPNGSPGLARAGWRSWISCSFREFDYTTTSVHRDNIYLDLPGYYTIVYFINLTWDPQHYGETLFHGNNSETGDYTGKYLKNQDRGFPVGDPENVVNPRPGRFMIFDSRYLHQIKPAASYGTEGLFAAPFRVKLKGAADIPYKIYS
jgi:hypothetical protein